MSQVQARPVARQRVARSAVRHAAWIAILLGQSALAADFVYQGQLHEHGEPVSGQRSIRLQVFDRATAGQALSGVIELPSVSVERGAFEVPVQLPEELLARDLLWLELAVSDANGHKVAFPQRQPASPKAGLGASCWELTGNADTTGNNFLGTTTSAPLQLRVEGVNVVSYNKRNNSTNVVAGQLPNVTGTAEGVTIAGGGRSGAPLNCGRTGNQTCAHTVTGNFGTIGGGRGNRVDALLGTVAGGASNSATELWATVGGGDMNIASGQGAVVPGGVLNEASGNFSMAAGVRANAIHQRSFVWNDGGAGALPTVSASSNREREFKVMASNGIRFNDNLTTNTDLDVSIGPRPDSVFATYLGLINTGGSRATIAKFHNSGVMVFNNTPASETSSANFRFDGSNTVSPRFILTGANGAHLTAGGTWTNGSSAAFKEAFERIDSVSILDRLLALPMATWRYRDSAEGRHLGPTAEDFAAAFGLGDSSQHIATVDADGVALAAIQGLAQRSESREAALEARIAALEARLAAVLGALGSSGDHGAD